MRARGIVNIMRRSLVAAKSGLQESDGEFGPDLGSEGIESRRLQMTLRVAGILYLANDGVSSARGDDEGCGSDS